MTWRTLILLSVGYTVGWVVSTWLDHRPGGPAYRYMERAVVAEVRWETAAFCASGGGTPTIYFNGTRDEDLQLSGCLYESEAR